MYEWEQAAPEDERRTYKRAVIIDFLRRCNRYADDKLAGYGARLAREDPEALALRILQWSAYRAFNVHAIGELERGELEDWLKEDPAAIR